MAWAGCWLGNAFLKKDITAEISQPVEVMIFWHIPSARQVGQLYKTVSWMFTEPSIKECCSMHLLNRMRIVSVPCGKLLHFLNTKTIMNMLWTWLIFIWIVILSFTLRLLYSHHLNKSWFLLKKMHLMEKKSLPK